MTCSHPWRHVEGLRTRLLNAALLAQSVITIATTTMVPDGAPRPPDRASAWCSPGGCPASKQPRGQATPARVCEEPEGRGLRGKQRCPLEGSCPPRPLRESAESRPTAAASATRLGHEGCGLGSVSETPRGTPTLLCPTRSSESSLPGSPALPGSERQPASRPHTLAPHAHPGLGAEAGLRLSESGETLQLAATPATDRHEAVPAGRARETLCGRGGSRRPAPGISPLAVPRLPRALLGPESQPHGSRSCRPET